MFANACPLRSSCLLHDFMGMCYDWVRCAGTDLLRVWGLANDKGIGLVNVRLTRCVFLLVSFVFFYLGISFWLPFSSIFIVGDGEAAAEKSVERQIQNWRRLHFLTRTDRIATTLYANPWVDAVSAYKAYDGSLRIRVGYKRPVLRAISGRYLVDATGQVIDVQVTDDLLRLPVYDGEAVHQRQAYKLWSRLASWQDRLLVVTRDPFSGWALLFDNKVTVRLGSKNIEERLDLFLKVASNWSLEASVSAQVFDMRYNNSFTHKKYTS